MQLLFDSSRMRMIEICGKVLSLQHLQLVAVILIALLVLLIRCKT